MARVLWTQPASEDLAQIRLGAWRESPLHVERLVRKITAAPRRLKQFPESGPRVAELDRGDIRELFVSPFRILYSVQGDTCRIIAVLHSSRELTSTSLDDRLTDP